MDVSAVGLANHIHHQHIFDEARLALSGIVRGANSILLIGTHRLPAGEKADQAEIAVCPVLFLHDELCRICRIQKIFERVTIGALGKGGKENGLTIKCRRCVI
jgi:hypothetical protein